MAIPLLDDEFMKYWSKLSIAEKESLLIVAKNYLRARSEESDIGELRKMVIQQERHQYLQEGGISYSWEQVKEMAHNKGKRSDLSTED